MQAVAVLCWSYPLARLMESRASWSARVASSPPPGSSQALDFLPEMLAWPAGSRATDGVWAEHWYASVERSTHFESWRPREGELSPELQATLEECLPFYERLYEHRLVGS